MTVFTSTWNPAYEGTPADNENISNGASRIRNFKENIRERVEVNHSFEGDANDGKHTTVNLMIQAGNPAVDSTDGFIFTKTVLGHTELFWMDDLGNVLQLTSAGVINLATFPAGTRLIFPQAAAPTGWTLVNTGDDSLIRLDHSNGGAAAGSWTISGVTIPTSVTTTVSVTGVNISTSLNNTLGVSTTTSDAGSTATPTIAGHVLSEAELPPHIHKISGTTAAGGSPTGVPLGNGFGAPSDPETQSTGSGSAHGHPGSTVSLSLSLTSSSSLTGAISASSSFVNGTATASSPASSSFVSDGTWRPKYVNSIIASKN